MKKTVAIILIFLGIVAVIWIDWYWSRQGERRQVGRDQIETQRQRGSVVAGCPEVRIPSDFPSDIPLYSPGCVRNVVRNTNEQTIQVILTSEVEMDRVASFYSTELGSVGWKKTGNNFSSWATFIRGSEMLLVTISEIPQVPAAFGGKADQGKTSVSLIYKPSR